MKKSLLKIAGIAFIIGVSAYCNAEEVKAEKNYVEADLKVKLSGFAHFQAGYRNQSDLIGKEKNVSSNNRHFALYNDAALVALASTDVDELEFGAKIVLVPTARRKGSPAYNGSHIFISSNFGRFEGGSPIEPSDSMMIVGGIIEASGGGWDRYAYYKPQLMNYNGSYPSFVTFSEFFLDSKLVTSSETRSFSSEPGRRINYYTPNFEIIPNTKMQIGISFTPDSSNTGADNPDKQSSGTNVVNVSTQMKDSKTSMDRFEIDSTVKNAFSGGVTLEQNISDGIDLKLAVTGEYGKPAGKAKEFRKDIKVAEHTLKDLVTYNIGGVVNFGNFSCAGSYGSLNNSLTTKAFQKTGTDTVYYTGALAYKMGPISTSLSYFRSNQFKNIADAITLGSSYKIRPGISPYIEVSSYSLEGKPEHFPEAPKKKTRGTVALMGAKFSL